MTFDEFMATEMLPAECDDERVLVGMKLAYAAGFAAAIKWAATIAETLAVEPGSSNSDGELSRYYDCWKYGCMDAQEQIAEAIRGMKP